MIQEVNHKSASYIQDILKRKFHVLYEKDVFSKEFIYVEGNDIIGFIIYSLIYDRIELDYIYVDSSKRNRGIASKLMQQMIQDGIRNNIQNITLEVNVHNIEAISLYKKCGFIVAATRQGYYNGQDGYLMIRE